MEEKYVQRKMEGKKESAWEMKKGKGKGKEERKKGGNEG